MASVTMEPTPFDSPAQIMSDSDEVARCPHGIADAWSPLPFTLRELSMLHMINAITDKPAWHEKVFDDTIAAKWKAEALANSTSEEARITLAAADWCIEELREKAEEFNQTGCVAVLDASTKIVKGDSVIEPALKKDLQKACEALHDIPERFKDYHPNSNNQVLNLIHPSLFPVVYGTTKALLDGTVDLANCNNYTGKGTTIPVPDVQSEFYSNKFQWLPCAVHFTGDRQVKITSYINNLHPLQHPALYLVVEKFIAKAIPLWNMCLTKRRGILDRAEDLRRIQCWEQIWDLSEPEYESPPPEGTEVDSDLDPEDVQSVGVPIAQWRQHRRVIVPDPPSFDQGVKPWNKRDIDLQRDFSERGLQVIVKLASIELTPESPVYGGGNWHLEGMLNERIAATAIYYYDTHNVTENELFFRTSTDELDYNGTEERYGKVVQYDQSDFGGLEDIYGLGFGDGDCIQNLGSIITREGRMLAFPNTLQHQVSPLRLTDPTKPGHRRILVLWLVDPHVTIPSTAHVPPQQRDWWSPKVLEASRQMGNLPVEVSNMIFDNVDDCPMSLEKAKELRLELMAERSRYTETVDSKYAKGEYFFCEH